MIKRIIVLGLIIVSWSAKLKAQELDLDVTVTTPQLSLVDPKVFKTLERSVEEFMNNTRWTNDFFQPEERIQGNLQIQIKGELSATTFTADIRVSSFRPVFDSSYGTPLINFIDKDLTFSYVELQAIEDSRNGFVDNLSSVLTFYAYLMIGLDYDSFSDLGGEPHFQTCLNIINNVPTSNGADQNWTAQGARRGRYWIIENLLHPKVRPFRKAMYAYHRLSLDVMTKDITKAQSVMLSAISDVGQVERAYPNAMVVQMFTDSKRSEILEIFKESERSTQNKIYSIMTRIDPARSTDYGIFK